MGNPQHLEWLLEGVEAWNARRKREPFTPDLSGMDVRGAFQKAGKLDGWGRYDLREADLRGADLWGAHLREADLGRADLWGANVKSALSINNVGKADFTDLSVTKELTQSQLDEMDGDSGTIIPAGLTRPAHWPVFEPTPELGEPSTGGEDVVINSGRVGLAAASLPERSDLHTLFDDLAEEVEDIARAGNFNNISTLLDTAFSRFRRICQSGFETLDEVRFGVQIDKLDTQFKASRSDMAAYAPDREGAVEAMLIGARLIAARLPKFKAFLAEQTPNEGAVEEHFAEVGEALAQVAEALAQDTAHFEPELAARVKEYWETASIKAYLAGAALLNNVAHKVFSGVRRVMRGVASEGEKLVYKGIAKSLVAAAGVALNTLAAIVPAELGWLAAWLVFVAAL